MMKKSRKDVSRYELAKFDLHKIKELLKGKPRSSKELMGLLGISSSVLKRRIDELLKSGEVEAYEVPEDRRRTLYRIADQEKVKASSAIYLAKQFLDSLKNPIFKEKPVKVGNYKVTVSCFFEGGDAHKLAKIEPEGLEALAEPLKAVLSISKAEKVAFVVTAEEK
jgi:DNA-binding MarR family transcriptional regulator